MIMFLSLLNVRNQGQPRKPRLVKHTENYWSHASVSLNHGPRPPRKRIPCRAWCYQSVRKSSVSSNVWRAFAVVRHSYTYCVRFESKREPVCLAPCVTRILRVQVATARPRRRVYRQNLRPVTVRECETARSRFDSFLFDRGADVAVVGFHRLGNERRGTRCSSEGQKVVGARLFRPVRVGFHVKNKDLKTFLWKPPADDYCITARPIFPCSRPSVSEYVSHYFFLDFLDDVCSWREM